MKPDISTNLLEQAYKRGQRDGYALGLRDGRLQPDELKAKHESMKTWVPKRRTDKQDWVPKRRTDKTN